MGGISGRSLGPEIGEATVAISWTLVLLTVGVLVFKVIGAEKTNALDRISEMIFIL